MTAQLSLDIPMSLDDVVTELRRLHLKDGAHFAKLLKTAESLRTPVHYTQEELKAHHVEKNRAGYTRNESRAGGRNAGIKANRAAIARAFPNIYYQLFEKGYDGFARTLTTAVKAYGLDFFKMLKEYQERKANSASNPEEAEDEDVSKVLDALARHDHDTIRRITLPID